MRSTRKFRSSARRWSKPLTYQWSRWKSSRYGSTVRSVSLYVNVTGLRSATASNSATSRRSSFSLEDGIGLKGRDQLLDAFVAGLEGVLAQNRALRLIVQLQVHPVDRVVALALLGAPDELAAQPSARRLRRLVDGSVDRLVGAHALDEAPRLHAVEEAAFAVDVVVLEIDARDLRGRP